MPTWKERFSLPMTATFVVSTSSKGCVARALDFDLVSTADDEQTALAKLRFAVKSYIEFGLGRGWDEHIRFPAPSEHWNQLRDSKVVNLMPPIEIDGTMVLVYESRTNEAVCAA